ncbi:MAG: NAD-dependent epimerase/dehydratase family protein [Euryarchaeota archaeon]|nr:NAD-dependent epimerase/dehydratase family protein [Euryarchaeota archaeon]
MELKDRTILVTGCAGFIASHLVEELLKRDNRVVGIDNLSAGKREFMKGILSDPNFHFIEDDLLTMDLTSSLKDVDILCHFAANPDVRLGASDTKVHFDQNIIVTYRLLEAGRENGVRDILFPSTSTVYGETEVIPTPEDYGPLLPISVYGASKLACEALIASYCHSFQQNAVMYRFANVVGPRSTHNVLHDFIRKLRENSSSLEILGAEPGTSKSYVHVSDCVNGMIAGAEATKEQVEIFNIGSLDWMTVKDIADIVTEEMNLEPEYQWTGGVRGGRGWVGDVKKMRLSIDKLTSIGWVPEMNSREAIRRAVQEILT